jgi:hypothetical protein
MSRHGRIHLLIRVSVGGGAVSTCGNRYTTYPMASSDTTALELTEYSVALDRAVLRIRGVQERLNGLVFAFALLSSSLPNLQVSEYVRFGNLTCILACQLRSCRLELLFSEPDVHSALIHSHPFSMHLLDYRQSRWPIIMLATL